MKLFLKFIIFIVVLACAAPFILKRTDGRPWMSFSDLKTPDLSVPDISPITDQVRKLHNTDSDDVTRHQTTVFKWQDKNGIWHFSDEASTTAESEEIIINHNTNMVHIDTQGTTVEAPQTKSDESLVNNNTQALDPDSNPYEQLPGLIDKAKNVEQLLNQRQQQQEKILKQLDN